MSRALDLYNEIKGLFADLEDGRHKALLLFDFFCGKSPFEFADTEQPPRVDELKAAAERVANGYPVQYAMGEWSFLDLTLSVGDGVLIPRDDTVSVALAAAEQAKKRSPASVLDLCSGSGAIAAAVAHMCPDAAVVAVELYDEAFAYLRKNTFLPNMRAVQADVFGFERTLEPRSIDVIVSNPPYVTESEYSALDETVKYEPRTALVGDGFYEYIARSYSFALKKGGALVFEAGDNRADEVVGIMRRSGFSSVQTLTDDNRNNRVVTGVFD